MVGITYGECHAVSKGKDDELAVIFQKYVYLALVDEMNIKEVAAKEVNYDVEVVLANARGEPGLSIWQKYKVYAIYTGQDCKRIGNCATEKAML